MGIIAGSISAQWVCSWRLISHIRSFTGPGGSRDVESVAEFQGPTICDGRYGITGLFFIQRVPDGL